MTGPQVAGRPAADVVTRAVDTWCADAGHPCPDDVQVGMVLRALADYATLEAMRGYRRHDGPAEPFEPSTEAAARWLHDTADVLVDGP